MRHADFFTAAARPLAPTAASAPTVAANGAGAGAGFGGVFRQVQNEVGDFIKNGGGALAGAPSSTLSPEGRAALGRARGAVPAAAGAIDGAAPDTQRAALQRDFLDSIRPWAKEAGERLGVAPELVAAHAALESGWGRHPLRQNDGADTNNLFSLKAGAGWQGAVAAAATTEYEHGAALKKTEQFRSYPDQASAFRDYASLLLDNPRYRAALNTGADAHAFAQGLARGGYATDPAYADKLTRLAQRLQASGAAALQSDD